MLHSETTLNSIEFLVVQEISMSETAKFADVVLSGASFFEKSGTFTNGERRVQRVNEVIPPPDYTPDGFPDDVKIWNEKQVKAQERDTGLNFEHPAWRNGTACLLMRP